jgi:hypothetical protein
MSGLYAVDTSANLYSINPEDRDYYGRSQLLNMQCRDSGAAKQVAILIMGAHITNSFSAAIAKKVNKLIGRH